MPILQIAIADDVYKVLEETFQPEEIDVFINQSVKTHLQELYQRKGLDPFDFGSPAEDENSQEWPTQSPTRKELL